MKTQHAREISPVEAPHGEIVREYFGAAVGLAKQHSLAHITLPPGKSSLKHYHPSTEESYYILSGEGLLVMNEETAQLTNGDAVVIPIGTVHKITNTGKDDLVFLAICTPPWTPDCSVFVD